jgi:hypothetical protein
MHPSEVMSVIATAAAITPKAYEPPDRLSTAVARIRDILDVTLLRRYGMSVKAAKAVAATQTSDTTTATYARKTFGLT